MPKLPGRAMIHHHQLAVAFLGQKMPVEEVEHALLGALGIRAFKSVTASLDRFEFCLDPGIVQTFGDPTGLFIGYVRIVSAVYGQHRRGARRHPIQRAGSFVRDALVLQIAAQEQRQDFGGVAALAVGLGEVGGAVIVHYAGNFARLIQISGAFQFSDVGVSPMNSVRVPPADSPVTPMRCGSRLKRRALARSQRMAVFTLRRAKETGRAARADRIRSPRYSRAAPDVRRAADSARGCRRGIRRRGCRPPPEAGWLPRGTDHIESQAISFAAGDRIFKVRLPDQILRNGKSGGGLRKQDSPENYSQQSCFDTTNHFLSLLTGPPNCGSVPDVSSSLDTFTEYFSRAL